MSLLPTCPARLPALDSAVSRYLRALRQGAVPCRADRDPDAQTANYRQALERNELRAAQVRQVLDSIGVPPVQHLAFRRYALHLDKLCRKYSGRTLKARARLALDYWTASGLDPAILRTVAQQVFGLSLPRL